MSWVPAFTLPSFPKLVQVEPTNLCNLQCKHCPRNIMVYPQGFMSFDLFKKIIDQCKGKETFVQLCYLGEPLLHSQLKQFLQYAYEHEVKTGIVTNGILLTSDVAEWLLDYATKISVSIDRATAQEYEKIRAGANFEEVVTNTKHLCRLNQKKRKIAIRIAAVVPNDDETASNVLNKIQKLWNMENVEVAPLQLQDYYSTGQIVRSVPCFDGLRGLIIRWDGNASFCCGDINSLLDLDNINDHSIQEIWLSKKFHIIRQDILSLSYKNPVCQNCNIHYPSRNVKKS